MRHLKQGDSMSKEVVCEENKVISPHGNENEKAGTGSWRKPHMLCSRAWVVCKL